MVNHLLRFLSLDLRSLAIARILIGLVFLHDALHRLTNVRAHYSNWGVYPPEATTAYPMNDWSWSLSFVNNTVTFQALLFLMGAMASVFFILGYKTKIAGLLVWIIHISSMIRNPMVNQGADVEMAVILFWCLFLPIQARIAFDSYKFDSFKEDNHFSFVSVAYIFQIAAIYFFSGVYKMAPEWTDSGVALKMVYELEQFSLPLGQWLLQFPSFLTFMTKAAWGVEYFSALLLVIPLFFLPQRILYVLLIVGLHTSIALTLAVGNFPYISIAAVIALIPTEVWNKLKGIKRSITIGENGPKEWQQVMVFILFSYAMLWNIQEMPNAKRLIPNWAMGIGPLFKIDQRWDMFSPYPFTDDGWYVIPGKLTNGAPVDVYNLRRANASYDKPKNVADTFEDFRWRKYLNNLYLAQNSEKRLYYGRYLCRRWAERFPNADQKLKTFDIYYMLERTQRVGPPDPVQRIKLWSHKCS